MNAMQNLPLRDIHLPDAVLWWPPAPGWWLLLILIGAIGLWLWHRRHHRSERRVQQLALNELQQIETFYHQHNDQQQALENISILLRRIALSRYPRARVASLTRMRWLQFLDGIMHGDEFINGSGRCLADAPYNPAADADIPPLIDLCRRWLHAEFAHKSGSVRAIGKTAKADTTPLQRQ